MSRLCLVCQGQGLFHLYIYFPLARFYFQYTTGSQSSRQTKVLSVTAPLLVRSHYNRITYYALDTQLLSYGPTGISYVGSFADFINEQSNLHLFSTAPNTITFASTIHSQFESSYIHSDGRILGLPNSRWKDGVIKGKDNLRKTGFSMETPATKYAASSIINLGFGGQTDETNPDPDRPDTDGSQAIGETLNPFIAFVANALSRRKL